MSKDQYHVWLTAHPEKDAEWLSQAMHAGFEIHHIDGDHYNNDPANLVLIEHNDHMRLHGGGLQTGTKRDWESAATRIRLGEAAYNLRLEGKRWSAIGEALGYDGGPKSSTSAINIAAHYARLHGKTWPMAHPAGCRCSHHKRSKAP